MSSLRARSGTRGPRRSTNDRPRPPRRSCWPMARCSSTCRLGTDREGADGHTGVFASPDAGDDVGAPVPRPRRSATGTAGRARRAAGTSPSSTPGRAHRRRPVDRPLGPGAAVGPPGDAGPPRRCAATISRSTDGGLDVAGPAARRPRAAPGRLDAPARSCGSPDGDARPAVRALEGARRPDAGHPGGLPAAVARRRRRPGPTTSSSPATPTTPSTTGTSGSTRTRSTAASSTCSGPTTRAAGPRHRHPHLAGARRMAGRGPSRSAPACRASTASRSRSVATVSWPSTRIGTNPPGIRAALSEDFGQTWDPATELVVWASDAGTEPGAGPAAGRRKSSGTTWAPGSSAIRAAPSCRTARSSSCSMAGAGVTRSAPLGADPGVTGGPDPAAPRISAA